MQNETHSNENRAGSREEVPAPISREQETTPVYHRTPREVMVYTPNYQVEPWPKLVDNLRWKMDSEDVGVLATPGDYTGIVPKYKYPVGPDDDPWSWRYRVIVSEDELPVGLREHFAVIYAEPDSAATSVDAPDTIVITWNSVISREERLAYLRCTEAQKAA